jgi:hypothetical protein
MKFLFSMSCMEYFIIVLNFSALSLKDKYYEMIKAIYSFYSFYLYLFFFILLHDIKKYSYNYFNLEWFQQMIYFPTLQFL